MNIRKELEVLFQSESIEGQMLRSTFIGEIGDLDLVDRDGVCPHACDAMTDQFWVVFTSSPEFVRNWFYHMGEEDFEIFAKLF